LTYIINVDILVDIAQ